MIYKVLTFNFVQIKYDVLDELSIVQICATNFTDAELVEGKNLICKECGGTPKNRYRKWDDKKNKLLSSRLYTGRNVRTQVAETLCHNSVSCGKKTVT